MKYKTYPNIDMEKSGTKLKMMLETAGYDVSFLQSYLHLACPQSIYKWFKGKRMPSIGHLYAMSLLLNVHMEELLVPEKGCLRQDRVDESVENNADKLLVRLKSYCDYRKRASYGTICPMTN